MKEPTSAGETLRVERVRVRDLPGYAARLDAAPPGAVVPITPERALSQSRNPFASGDEVGLVVAQLDGRCVGYMGLVPGWLQLVEGGRQIFWMSTWLVDPSLRGHRVGYRILEEVLSLGYDLFGTMYTHSADRVLRAAGFREFGPLPYHEVDLRRAAPWAELTRAARRALRKGGGGWAAAAAALDGLATLPAKVPLYAWLLGRRRELLRRVDAEEIEQVSPELVTPEPARLAPVRFVRDAAVINWMLRYPWVREVPRGGGSLGYHFSRDRRLFRYVPLRFRVGSGPENYLVLSVGEGDQRTTVKLLDHRVDGEGAREAALALALRSASRYRADSIVLPIEFETLLERDPVLRLLTRRRERAYLGRAADPEGPVARALDRIDLSFPDGDVALT